MRTAMLGLVLALSMCGPAWADDDDEDLQPATRTVRFRHERFNPWENVGTTTSGQYWPLTDAVSDPPPRPAWPGKVGVITGPPPNVMGRAGEPPNEPAGDEEPYPGVYGRLR